MYYIKEFFLCVFEFCVRQPIRAFAASRRVRLDLIRQYRNEVAAGDTDMALISYQRMNARERSYLLEDME